MWLKTPSYLRNYIIRTVPANCSRYFDLKQVAEDQPIGMIDLDYDASNMFVINKLFNQNLIIHDSHYCTVNIFQLRQSVKNFEKILQGQSVSKIIDIGCGQGEFVEHLKSKNLSAVGFDPVLRNENEYLFKRYFEPSKYKYASNNIYTMRCVLPHIKDPFHFLEKIFEYDRYCQVYIEYQNLEWIVREKMWQQISHDHCNYFSIKSFEYHFNVIKKGIFGNGEWSYVLIGFKNKSQLARRPLNLDKLIELENNVSEIIAKSLERIRSRIGIYGAGGKGMLFAWELKKLGIIDVVAFDEQSLNWNKFLEASGVQVRNPIEIIKLDSFMNLLIMNPNHYAFAVNKYGAHFETHN